MVPSPGVKLCTTVVRGLSRPRRYAVDPRPSLDSHRTTRMRASMVRGVSCHQVVVIIYSSTMIGICHQLLGCDHSLETVKHGAAQVITGNNGGRQDRRFGNPLVAGSSPARLIGASAIEQLTVIAEQGVTEIVYQPTGPDIPHELEAFISAARAVPAGSQVSRPGAGRP
jgi:hypothetical protein